MKGSFGTQNELYNLRRVKARTKRTEIRYIYLLRHQHSKRGAIGGQDRTKGAFVGCLTRRLAVIEELLLGNCTLIMKNRRKFRPKRLEKDI